MRLGLMQGRLLPPVGGHIQEFPKNWKDEFALLNECGLDSVEWLLTKGSISFNPALRDPQSVVGYPISSICVDTLVDEGIHDSEYLRETLEPLCRLISEHPFVKTITIPLLEESSMEDGFKRKKFLGCMVQIAQLYPNINFSFEAELGIKELDEIVSLCDNFYVTYDTGNITSYGLDHAEYISTFSKKINNVHLKDRTFGARTVEPTQGDTDFKQIFKNLKTINYDGPYILQTARSIDGREKDTILRHKKIFEDLYAEAI